MTKCGKDGILALGRRSFPRTQVTENIGMHSSGNEDFGNYRQW